MGGRTKPEILLSRTDGKTYRADQVLFATAVFAVFLDDRPISLRTVHTLIDGLAKYPRVTFANVGHAFNLARKLNTLFKTDKFSVHALTAGPVIHESGV